MTNDRPSPYNRETRGRTRLSSEQPLLLSHLTIGIHKQGEQNRIKNSNNELVIESDGLLLMHVAFTGSTKKIKNRMNIWNIHYNFSIILSLNMLCRYLLLMLVKV